MKKKTPSSSPRAIIHSGKFAILTKDPVDDGVFLLFLHISELSREYDWNHENADSLWASELKAPKKVR